MEEHLTTSQVAQLLGVSDQAIRQWIAAGKLPGYRIIDGGWYRVDRKELEKFATARGLSIDWSILNR